MYTSRGTLKRHSWRTPQHRASRLLRGTVPVLVITLAAGALTVPLLVRGNPAGHDFQVHLSSWMEVAQQWHQGTAFPRWAAGANFGRGEPRFLFYPPASWLLGGGLGLICGWRVAPAVFVFGALCLAGLGMWTFSRGYLAPRDAAISTGVFVANPYHMLLVYHRCAYGELLASALLPLLVLAALRTDEASGKRITAVAGAFGGIWLCNAPAGVVATYSLGLVLMIQSILLRSLRPLVLGGVGAVLGMLLASFYVVPAAWQRQWVEIEEVLSPRFRPEMNFLFATDNDPHFLLFNWWVSIMALVEMLVAGGLLIHSRGHLGGLGALWVATFAAVLLMLPVSELAWRHLPQLRFVQFPWRWLLLLQVGVSMEVGNAASRSRHPIPVVIAVLFLLGGTQVLLLRRAIWADHGVEKLERSLETGSGYEGLNEYRPRGSHAWDPGKMGPLVQVTDASGREVISGSVTIRQWDADVREFAISVEQISTATLRLLDYPTWRVLLDGGPISKGREPGSGLLTVRIPAGESTVRVFRDETPDQKVGIALSATGLVVLVGLAMRQHVRAGA